MLMKNMGGFMINIRENMKIANTVIMQKGIVIFHIIQVIEI